MPSPPQVSSGSPKPIISDRHWYNFIEPLLDAASIMASLIAVKLFARGEVDETAWAMGLIAIITFFLSSQLTGLLRRERHLSVDREIFGLTTTWILTVLFLAMTAFVTRYGEHFSRAIIAAWIVISPAMIGLTRMCLRIVRT